MKEKSRMLSNFLIAVLVFLSSDSKDQLCAKVKQTVCIQTVSFVYK